MLSIAKAMKLCQLNLNGFILYLSCQEFNSEPVIPIYSAKPDQVKKALNYVYNVAANKLGGKELELLIAILPDNNGPLYGTWLANTE